MSPPSQTNLFDLNNILSDMEDTVEDITSPIVEPAAKSESEEEDEGETDYQSDGSDTTIENPFSVEPLHKKVHLRSTKGTIAPSWLHAYELEFPIKLLIISKNTVSNFRRICHFVKSFNLFKIMNRRMILMRN